MKVKELIDILQKLNPDKTVFYECDGYIEVEEVRDTEYDFIEIR